jgi:hypothetical protein
MLRTASLCRPYGGSAFAPACPAALPRWANEYRPLRGLDPSQYNTFLRIHRGHVCESGLRPLVLFLSVFPRCGRDSMGGASPADPASQAADRYSLAAVVAAAAGAAAATRAVAVSVIPAATAPAS